MLIEYHATSHETPNFPKLEKSAAVYKKKNTCIIITKSKLTFRTQFTHKYRRHIQILTRLSIIFAYFKVPILRGFQEILNVSLC